jgi:hypothetical protein
VSDNSEPRHGSEAGVRTSHQPAFLAECRFGVREPLVAAVVAVFLNLVAGLGEVCLRRASWVVAVGLAVLLELVC